MANYLVIRIEQYESDQSYPYLSQQGSILSQVVEQVLEDFPFCEGEQVVFRERPNCGTEYICINLNGEVPTEGQIEYMRKTHPWAYKVGNGASDVAPRVAAYEVISEVIFEERKPTDTRFGYYYWSHDESQELSLV